MTPFDAELHLRLLGERGLVETGDPRRNPHDASVAEAARALVAVGAIELDDAAEIVEGYGLAQSLRDGRGLWRRYRLTPPAAPTAPTAPEPRRTALCNITLERPTEAIHVSSVTLTPSETRLSVVIQTRSAPGLGSRRRGRGMMRMHSAFSYPITDDRGGTGTTTGFSGGGSDREWRGHLTAGRPLAMDTAWIELDGTRIELIDAPGRAR